MTFAPKGGYKNSAGDKPKEQISPSSKSPIDPKSVKLPDMSRPVSKTSFYFYTFYKQLWLWSMVTLPFDFLLLLLLPLSQRPFLTDKVSDYVEQFNIILIVVSFTWFIRNWALVQITGWKATRGKLFNFIEKNPALIAIFLGLAIAAEVFLKFGQLNFLSVAVAFVIVFGALRSFRQSWKERLEKEKNFSKDLVLQVEAFNLKLFLLHLVPLIAARLTVLISAITFPLSVQSNPALLLALCVGCIMLSMMQAEECYFMIICRRCGSKTSRFLDQFEACLACIHNEKRAPGTPP